MNGKQKLLGTQKKMTKLSLKDIIVLIIIAEIFL